MSNSTKPHITDQPTLEQLFPVPTIGRTPYTSTLHPGCSSDSSQALAELLRGNFDNRPAFNDPIPQQLFAIWGSGGMRSLLKAANAATPPNPPPPPPHYEINEDNWANNLGNTKLFPNYQKFFANQALSGKNSFEDLLYKYVFSPNANTGVTVPPSSPPLMINRLFSGMLHPFVSNILVGQGSESNTPGLLVEGLASAAVSTTMFNNIPPPPTASSTTQLQRQLSRLSLENSGTSHTQQGIVNPPGSPVDEGYSSDPEASKPEAIGKTASESAVVLQSISDVEKKIQILSFFTTIIYGVGGLQGGQAFKADFNLMNLTAAAYANHSLLKYLGPASTDTLFNSFSSAALQMWDKAGRPEIDISHFYGQTTVNPLPPGSIPMPHPSVLDPTNQTPNSFYPILQSAVKHPDPHLAKIQRALSLFSSWYGTLPPGSFKANDFPGGPNAPVLNGIEKLDGTLFVRVAGLTMDRLGWVREGQAPGSWD